MIRKESHVQYREAGDKARDGHLDARVALVARLGDGFVDDTPQGWEDLVFDVERALEGGELNVFSA